MSARERPILFSTPMVRALLAGTKTQTRRAVKNPDYFSCLTGDCPHQLQAECDADLAARSPYGVPGDLLYVRETWRTAAIYDDLKPTDLPPGARASYDADYLTEPNDGFRGKTRVSIHMPRWASRITLRITDVRVERLQDISEADALAEGVEQNSLGFVAGDALGTSAPAAYAKLWNHINGPGSWDENPWVWCVAFEVVS